MPERIHDVRLRGTTRHYPSGREIHIGCPAGYAPGGQPLWHTSEGRLAECLLPARRTDSEAANA